MELRQPPRASERPTTDRVTRALLLLIVALLLGLSAWVLLRPRTAVEAIAADRERQVAAKLQAAGALDEAAALYEDYLQLSAAPAEQRARIAYSLGNNYLDTGRYDKALRWFYEAETLAAEELAAGELADELASRIVHCLDRLGRHHAAQATLESRVGLEPLEVERASGDPVVARLGQTEIHRSEVLRGLDAVPPEIAARFSTPEGRQELLRKYVADELLWRKAVKLEYDRDPEVERQSAALLKQLAVARFVEREVLAGIEIDEADLRNYFEANRDRYRQAQADEPAPEVSFEQMRQVVERDYRMMKMQAAYDELIDTELSTQEVELFPERMSDGP